MSLILTLTDIRHFRERFPVSETFRLSAAQIDRGNLLLRNPGNPLGRVRGDEEDDRGDTEPRGQVTHPRIVSDKERCSAELSTNLLQRAVLEENRAWQVEQLIPPRLVFKEPISFSECYGDGPSFGSSHVCHVTDKEIQRNALVRASASGMEPDDLSLNDGRQMEERRSPLRNLQTESLVKTFHHVPTRRGS